jgi:predicted transcriptional regulator of viral defense system
MSGQRADDRALNLARGRGFISARALVARGIHSQTLTRLVAAGALERVARGQYRLPDEPITENHALAIAAKVSPHGVVCLLTALRFHQLGSQLPADVWIALDRRTRRPPIGYPRLRIVRFSGAAFTEGIETHSVEGQALRVYGVAKTLADAFKYRNKIGLDVALEALRDGWRQRRFTMDEIDHYARVCRVEKVMRPYLEALVA